MAIVGVTDRNQDDTLHMGYPLIARLYKGDAKVDPKRPGKDRDTFRVEFAKPYDTPEIRAAWDRIYGATPTSLDWVFLLGYTPEQVFPTWMEEWTKTVMLHRCDGVEQVRHYDKAKGKYTDVKAPCACAGRDKPSCQRVGRLNLWLPVLMRETGVKGYVAIATHSINDLVKIDASVKALFRDYETVSAVPLTFGRKPESISTPMNGDRATTVKSLLYLNVMPQYIKQEIGAALDENRFGLPAGNTQRALPAPKPVPVEPSAPTTKPQVWTGATKERARLWINRNFGLDAATVIGRMNQPLEHFETVEAWQGAVKDFLRTNAYPIIARAIEVGEQSFDLVTTLGMMRVTGGASALERLFGDERDELLNRLDPADWTPGGQYPLNTVVWVKWATTEAGQRATGLSFNPPPIPDPQDEVTEGELIEEVNRDAENN